jgi:hypothetical protein
MPTLLSAALLQLSFRDVVTGIPHDAGALVAYVILGLFVFGIWRGSRPGGAKEGQRDPKKL